MNARYGVIQRRPCSVGHSAFRRTGGPPSSLCTTRPAPSNGARPRLAGCLQTVDFTACAQSYTASNGVASERILASGGPPNGPNGRR